MTNLTLTKYQPGGLATLCALQSEYYAREWGFDHRYEAVVSRNMSEFLDRYNPDRDFVQLVLQNRVVKGGIVIDSMDGQIAQLHWFILHADLRGSGMGSRLVTNAMTFVREKGYPKVSLSTFQGLDAARYLYEKSGFILTEEKEAATWGRSVIEQRFEWTSALNP